MRELVSKIVIKSAAKVDNRTRIIRGPHFAPTKVRYVKPGNTRRLNAMSTLVPPDRTPRPRIRKPGVGRPTHYRVESKVNPAKKHIVARGPQEKTIPLYGPKGLLGEATVLAVRHSNYSRVGSTRYMVRLEGVGEGWAAMVKGKLMFVATK